MTELIGDGLLPRGRPSGEVQSRRNDEHRPSGSAALLTAMCLGLLLSMFNATVVNVMLPTMRGALHVSGTSLQWVAALFTLCNAALLLAGGALGELIGKRMTFLSGVAVFTVGSAACAAAPTLGVLLAARTVQAIGVAVMTPQTLSILVTEYTDRTRRARAVGIWAAWPASGSPRVPW
ncbi:MFS transporter [Streptomyces kaempferi]